MILSGLSPSALYQEAVATTFPKWNSLCLLQHLGLPTLNAAFLSARTPPTAVRTTMADFAATVKSDRVLVRSDGGREIANYFRGGITLPIEQATETVESLLAAERAVILLEPTNRFTNQLAVNFLADRDGEFVIEVLGPGYDIADLNRGVSPAHYRIFGAVPDWEQYMSLGLSDVRGAPGNIDEQVRRHCRLADIGVNILPGMGVTVTGPPDRFAEYWLRANGYCDLWRPWRFEFSLSLIQSWYENAFLVANFIGRHRRWKALVLTWSKLDVSKTVYWDVVDAYTKYAVPSRH